VWTRFARCIVVGFVGGLAVQALAVAFVFSLANPAEVNRLNSWAEGMAVLYQTLRRPLMTQMMLLSPALLSAFSLSIAQAIANRTTTTSQCVAPAGYLFATMFG